MDYKLNLGHSLDGMSLPWGNASNGHIALLGQSAGNGRAAPSARGALPQPDSGVQRFSKSARMASSVSPLTHSGRQMSKSPFSNAGCVSS